MSPVHLFLHVDTRRPEGGSQTTSCKGLAAESSVLTLSPTPAGPAGPSLSVSRLKGQHPDAQRHVTLGHHHRPALPARHLQISLAEAPSSPPGPQRIRAGSPKGPALGHTAQLGVYRPWD